MISDLFTEEMIKEMSKMLIVDETKIYEAIEKIKDNEELDFEEEFELWKLKYFLRMRERNKKRND